MFDSALNLKTGPTGGHKTSVTTIKRCVTSPTREDLRIVYLFLCVWLKLYDPPISLSLI
jgi:hypothetical protein